MLVWCLLNKKHKNFRIIKANCPKTSHNMAMQVLKSFSHLQSELEEAKSSLKGVDENIKRLIGRDPSELPPRPGQKRLLDDKNFRQPFAKFSRGGFENDAPKRRNPNAVSVFKRLSDKVPDEPIKSSRGGIISKIIAAPKEVPSRQSVLDKQNKDEKFKARNRRMFGALLGTLQRFQQDESKSKKKEEKRTQIEKKIDDHVQQEKDDIKKERQELFQNRKKKQKEIKMIELKMLRMKEYTAWEQSQKPRTNFIVTKAKPHIHYLPRKMNDMSKELLEASKKDIEEQIEKRRQAVLEEMSHIEERMKCIFEEKTQSEHPEEKSTDRHNRRGSDSEMDDDMDEKMKSPSPEPKETEDDVQDNPNESAEVAASESQESVIDETTNADIEGQLNNEGNMVDQQEQHTEVACGVYENMETFEATYDSNMDTMEVLYGETETSSELIVTNAVEQIEQEPKHESAEENSNNM